MNVRLPVPAPLEPMQRTTEDAAALDRQRQRSEEIIREREQSGAQAIATRDAELQRQRRREDEQVRRARDLEHVEYAARATLAAARQTTNMGHVRGVGGAVMGVGAVVVGFTVAGLVGAAVALGSTVLVMLGAKSAPPPGPVLECPCTKCTAAREAELAAPHPVAQEW